MKLLAGTGILLRLFEPMDARHLVVLSAVRILEKRGHEFVTGSQNRAEFWNVCTRPATARGGFGLPFAVAELRLTKVELGFPLLLEDESTYPIWRHVVLSLSIQGKQVHDARLAALMTSRNITHILTLDRADFLRYPGITVFHPADVVAGAP